MTLIQVKHAIKYPILLQNTFHIDAQYVDDRRLFLLFDTTTESLFLKPLKQLFSKKNEMIVMAMEVGEKAKSQRTVATIHQRLFRAGFTRHDLIISIGGGVVSDTAGFAAATYMRGIPWISCPTTLLAMVDASIGGKTGVNHRYGKNLIGAFYFPELVIMNCQALNRLNKREIASGMAEMIKHALITDGRHFNHLMNHCEDFFKADRRPLAALIKKSIAVKRDIVFRDPFEQHERQNLNLGHTIAHGLEIASDYKMPHGHAVLYGIIIETALGVACDIVTKRFYLQLAKALIPALIDHPQYRRCIRRLPKTLAHIAPFLKRDKKNRGRTIGFVFCRRPGDIVRTQVDFETLTSFLGDYQFPTTQELL